MMHNLWPFHISSNFFILGNWKNIIWQMIWECSLSITPMSSTYITKFSVKIYCVEESSTFFFLGTFYNAIIFYHCCQWFWSCWTPERGGRMNSYLSVRPNVCNQLFSKSILFFLKFCPTREIQKQEKVTETDCPEKCFFALKRAKSVENELFMVS